MFERYQQPLLSPGKFFLRLFYNALIAAGLVFGSLLLGATGYHRLENLRWVDAIENASMILTGMGPVDVLKTDEGKLFASAYALFSGIVVLSIVAVLFAPLVHRFLHRLHLDLEDDSPPAEKP